MKIATQRVYTIHPHILLIKSGAMQIEPFKLERFFAQHEFSAQHLLSCSDAESMSVKDLLAFEPGARESLENTWLGYTESKGHPSLRAEIAKLYGNAKVENILLHTGAQEPIFNLLNSCLTKDDHVIVHFPCYQSLYAIPRAIGCETSLWHARFENGFRLDLAELKGLLRPNTKLVIVNTPHNPTGYLMRPEEQRELIGLLRDREILLLSDEVYRGLEMDPTKKLPAAVDLYENAISLGVLSKSYGLAGLRLGWVATRNQKIYDSMAEYKDYTTICNSVVAETLSTIAVRHGDKIIERNRGLVRENWKLAEAFLNRHANLFEWFAPEAGTMAFPRAKPHFDLDAFAKDLLVKTGAMLITGQYFDQDAHYFRLGLGRKSFPEALGVMEKHLKKEAALFSSTR